MTKNEFIAIRICELEARRSYAAKLVMNRDMAHEVKICDAQIQALLKERDLVVLYEDDDGVSLLPNPNPLKCAHRWNVPGGGLVQDEHILECEKCGATRPTKG